MEILEKDERLLLNEKLLNECEQDLAGIMVKD
jgi:hypothetical protein